MVDGVLQWPPRCAPLGRMNGDAGNVDGVEQAILKFDPIRLEERSGPTPLIDIVSGEVHVWGFLLDIDRAELAAATRCLSRDELERAARLVSERHRRRFIAAHAALREVLSRYCRRFPQELVFHKTSAGKPFLPGEAAMRFNLTHSHGIALIAVANDREVGVDLEQIRPEVDVVRLARRFLSNQDRTFIEGGEPRGRHERFLQTWVAREAVFKAEGRGITLPLHHDHVELSNGGRDARLIRRTGGSGADFPVRFLSLETEWVGAVAAAGTDWRVTYRSMSGS